jgi:hypothetical protein
MPAYDEALYSPAQLTALRANDEAMARQIKFASSGFTAGPLLIGGGGPTFIPPGPTFTGPTTGGLGGLGQAACNLITNPAARAICIAGAGLLPGGGTTPLGGGGQGTPTPECGVGMVKVGNKCVSPGDIFPGGAPFITGAGNVPVAGAFGIPGYSPTRVQQPVRRCPAGFALAKDGVCYVRSQIPRKFRAHPPAKRPPLTGADAAALRRIGALQGRVKRLAKAAGLSMTTKRAAPAKRKR